MKVASAASIQIPCHHFKFQRTSPMLNITKNVKRISFIHRYCVSLQRCYCNNNAKIKIIYMNCKFKIVKNKKMDETLERFYDNLPRQTSPKSDFIRKITDECGVSFTTAMNWVKGKNKPLCSEHSNV